ncbi:MAG: serine hydrolase [Lachnospiraceae bacterium]|nr:serine hydrolase [Lachnospiraceae bacterium]
MRRFIATVSLLAVAIFIIGFLNSRISDKYDDDSNVYINWDLVDHTGIHYTDADTIVYRTEDINSEGYDDLYYSLFINDSDKTVLAAKNPHERMYPASMTKLMTAIIVCDKIDDGSISYDDVVKLSHNYNITVPGVGPCELTYGCEITVDNLMHGLLIESNNYYALILAEYIAGDVESFCQLMNDRAYSIGATNTHYMNPHGLDDPEHYSTAYDLYLITKEAKKYPYIRDISQMASYSYVYKDSYGNQVETETNTTNMFVSGKAVLPSGFKISACKTGTTTGAGNCLALWLDKDGKDYFLVASHATSRSQLYTDIAKIMCYIQ